MLKKINDILLYKKFKTPLHQSLFNKLFSVEKESWNNIYKNKIECKYRSSDKCDTCVCVMILRI